MSLDAERDPPAGQSAPEPPTQEQPQSESPAAEELRRPPEVVASSAPTAVKADLTKRFVAGIIDAVAAVVVGFIPFVGGLISAAYWLTRDGLDLEFMPNRSLGKKLAGLQPVTLDGKPLDLTASAKRNWPFAIGGLAQALVFIPIIGWLLLIPVALAALVLVIVEIFFVVTDEEGRRLGDKIANTKVIEVGGGAF